MREKEIKYREVSAKSREGVENLLEEILVEVNDLEVEKKECI